MKVYEKIIEKIESYPVVPTFCGLVVIALAAALGLYTSAPSWAYVLIGIMGWWFLGYTYWAWECYRASGPRGVYRNPSGMIIGVGYLFTWLTFGVFISMAHVFYRYRRRRLYEQGVYR